MVISDVHLCEGLPGSDLWMRWRQKSFFPDDDFASLLAWLQVVTLPGQDTIELVFNGDLFDFDAARVVGNEAPFEDLPRTESVAVELLGRILDDHPGYLHALGAMLAAGHEVVFISGNHDAQLGFPKVRALLTERLVAASGDPSVRSRVHHRAWFHQTVHGIHLEHGNQFDHFCAFRYPMDPVVEGEWEIPPTVGSLAFRYLGSRIGYFNPHVDSTFMMGLGEYVEHWARHYALTRRSLGFTWLKGTRRLVTKLIQHRDRASGERERRGIAAAARETGVSEEKLRAHATLFAQPADADLHAVFREFWVDRVAFGAAAMAAAVSAPWVFRRRAVALPAAALLPVAFALYELLTPKKELGDTYAHIASMGSELVRIHGVRAVIFGHTHQPYGRWDSGIFYGNSGTWTAAYRDIACTIPADERGRPVIWLRSDGSTMHGGLFRWARGHLVPDPGDPEETYGATEGVPVGG